MKNNKAASNINIIEKSTDLIQIPIGLQETSSKIVKITSLMLGAQSEAVQESVKTLKAKVLQIFKRGKHQQHLCLY